MSHKWFRTRSVAQIAAAMMVAGVMVLPATAAQAAPSKSFIVEGSSAGQAAAAVTGAGGTVQMSLDLVHGVAAHLSEAAAASLSASGTVNVTPDLTVQTAGADFGASSAPAQSAAIDLGSGWSASAGQGIGVALVDTGVANLPADFNHLVIGPDFSGEGDGVDHYGHGTFMAGLIVGKAQVAPDGTTYSGVAPGATLVSVKVAGADGSTSMSKVIAGIGWVVTHRDALHIRVLNLSLGVDIEVPDRVNPLAAAVEATWASGITVVAAAGNDGAGQVTSPGNDPWVVTAGAVNPHGSSASSDFTVPKWSGRGPAKPDVLAPGVHTVSLRDPGSTVDLAHPSARVGDSLFKGSGTSMATAISSGAAAILAQDHPGATPDDIKGALVDGESPVKGSKAGALDISGADHATAAPDWRQHHPIAFDGLGIGLTNAMPWVGASWTGASWTGASWTGASWTGASWTGASWTGASWTGASWTGASWTGASWTGASWTGASWTVHRWG